MDTNPQRLRAVTFRESVRLPGSSMTANYIPSEDYPLTLYPALGLIKGTCKPGVQPMPHQARTRYYALANAKDLELLDEPVETAVREANGALVVDTPTRFNPTSGVFERATDDTVPAPPPTPAEAPRAKRGRPPKQQAAPAAAPSTIAPVITRPLPRTTAGTGPSGGEFR